MRTGASWACNYRVGRLEDGTPETDRAAAASPPARRDDQVVADATYR
jgi:hypothetical protein